LPRAAGPGASDRFRDGGRLFRQRLALMLPRISEPRQRFSAAFSPPPAGLSLSPCPPARRHPPRSPGPGPAPASCPPTGRPAVAQPNPQPSPQPRPFPRPLTRHHAQAPLSWGRPIGSPDRGPSVLARRAAARSNARERPFGRPLALDDRSGMAIYMILV
jgi:hypothetical protein